jgi:acyl dehydratase
MQPGDTFRLTRTCDRYRPLYYAAASGDFNPIHVDAEVARAVGLDGPILQGMCTFAWLAEACAQAAGDPGRVSLLSARFSRPVAIGDEVRLEGRCVALEAGVATLEVEARNQRGEEVLKNARAEVRTATQAPSPSRSTGDLATGSVQAPFPPQRGGEGRGEGAARYGPYPYEAGLEKIRDFALAVAGGIPTRVRWGPTDAAPHPWHVDEEAARASPYGAVIAPPTFAAVFAMQPFAAAIVDPANGIDLARLLHGEQELRLHGVIRAGDRLVTTGEIASDGPRGKLRAVAVRSRTVNQRGELVVEGIWMAVVR